MALTTFSQFRNNLGSLSTHLMAKGSISLKDWDAEVKIVCTLKLLPHSIFSSAKLKTVVLGEAEWYTASAWSWSQQSYGKVNYSF